MRIIAYQTQSIGSKIQLLESTGETSLATDNIYELLGGLLEPYEDTIKVCWELDATIAPILKLLGKERCSRLHRTHKCRLSPAESIFYIPGKVFSIEGVIKVDDLNYKTKASLYDLAQFYPEIEEPENLAGVQALGEKLLYELAKMGLRPDKLTSPVAIYEECVMRELDLPGIASIPKEAAEMAYRCSGRLWVEAYQIGYWKTAYDYDLTSAFPSVARDLVDLRQLEWSKSKKYQPEAVYGYVKCEVTIFDWVMVSPILREDENGGLSSPTGTWETYLTKADLDFIDKWKIGTWKIIEGWWAIPASSPLSKPLAVALDRLLAYKQGTGLQSALAKRMSVGIYGKFGEERKDEFGPYFNPVYFAEISTQVRLQVAEWLYQHDIGPRESKELLHVSIDGCLLNGEVKKPQNGNGKWRLSYVGEALVVSSGLVFYANKKPKGMKLQDVVEMVKEHPRESYYEKKIKRRVTLGDALNLDKFQDLGKEVEMVSSIDLLRIEHDRKFAKLPQTGQQLLSKKHGSKPVRIQNDL